MWKMLLFNIIYLIIHSFFGGGGGYCCLVMPYFCLPSHTKEMISKNGEKKKNINISSNQV